MSYIKTKKEFFLGLFVGMTLISEFFMVSYLVGGSFLGDSFEKVAKAVTFDSDIVPVPGAAIRIGTQAGDIQSINNTLFISSSTSNIGIGTSTPTERLVIDRGGIKFTNSSNRPNCNATEGPARRGTMWYILATSSGQPDILSVCIWSGTQYRWAEFQGK
jgi:hypothetical protein